LDDVSMNVLNVVTHLLKTECFPMLMLILLLGILKVV